MSSDESGRSEYFSQWPTRPDGNAPTVSFDKFNQFANNYPGSDQCPFMLFETAAESSSSPALEQIKTDSELPAWAYFLAHSQGLGKAVPIPLHPKLIETPLYPQLAYLLRVCKPFSHLEGLHGLTEAGLNANQASRGGAVKEIRKALARGHPVVVAQCTTRFDGIDVSVDDEAFCRLTFTPDTEVEAQDMVHYSSFHHTTMERFWEHRHNPAEVLNVLDFNSHLHAGRPLWMSDLYDDASARRFLSSREDMTIADVIRFPQWMLFGHPFSHTFTHHDTAGLSTYVIVVEGRKLWFMLKWTVKIVTPKLWQQRLEALRTGDLFKLEYEEAPPWIVGQGDSARVDMELYNKHSTSWEKQRVAEWVCADLQPGACLIMPPSTPHWVYKPSTTFSTGGHGLLWEALPLTEIGCRMDHLCDNTTNDVHGSMPLIHCSLSLQLPEDPQEALSRGRTVQELSSLVRLVLRPLQYRQRSSGADKRYNKISIGVLEKAAQSKMKHYQTELAVDLPHTKKAKEPMTEQEFEWATLNT